jgi:hypothetical protein
VDAADCRPGRPERVVSYVFLVREDRTVTLSKEAQ